MCCKTPALLPPGNGQLLPKVRFIAVRSPLANNDTPDGRAQNYRAEVHVTKKLLAHRKWPTKSAFPI
ncbi:MAG: hypothetical protein EOO62_33475 [Hymenobacter sp.]|nr:MAG: hypothetical protein EOO62_33475 [Hymenobacter sp.]